MAETFEDPSKKRRLEDGTSAFAENTAESRKEKLETWLKPLDNEQLVKLLLDIGSVNPGAFDEIHRACNDIPVNKKIFVRGLPWETTDQSLRAVFEQYGEIAEATVVMDKMTQKSKGYGFVTFKGMDGAHAALENPEKMIDGRVSLCNLAALRSSQPLPQRGGAGGAMQGAAGMMGGAAGGSGEDVSTRKIFVRGLSWDTTTESLRNLFSQYGELEDAVVTTDRASGKSKGYGFITYRYAANAAAAVAEPEKQLDGRLTHCNIAAEGASNRLKNQNFGGPQAGGQGQQWGMMGQQQQYPAQGGDIGQGAGQWGAPAGGQGQGFGAQGQWGAQQQYGAAQAGYGNGVQGGYGTGQGAGAYNGGGAYQAAGAAAGGAGAWGGQGY